MTSKVEVGSVLREAFTLYREQVGVLLPVAFWLFLAVGIVEELAYAYIVTAVFAGTLGAAATTLYQGMVVGLVRETEEERREYSAGEMLRSVRPVLLPLIGASMLAVVGVFLGFLFFIIPGFIAITFWAVIAPAIVVERTGAIKSFGRSQDLVSGNTWRVFAAVMLGLLIAAVLTVALILLADTLAYGPLIRIVSTALVGTISAPIGGLIAAILYFRLREIEDAPSVALDQAGDGAG